MQEVSSAAQSDIVRVFVWLLTVAQGFQPQVCETLSDTYLISLSSLLITFLEI